MFLTDPWLSTIQEGIEMSEAAIHKDGFPLLEEKEEVSEAVSQAPDVLTTAKTKINSHPRTRTETYVFLQVHGLVLYYVIVLVFAFWLMLDVWSENYRIMRFLGVSQAVLQDDLLKVIGYIVVGSIFGSVLYQIRELFHHYLKSESYDYRWIGKYVSAPWESAAMSMIVMAIMRGGVALFGGQQGSEVGLTNNFAAFGTGALVGFGMRDVVGWLGNIVRSVFVSDGKQVPENNPEKV
jgi:hypothetical protein